MSTGKRKETILFLAKGNDEHVAKALRFLRANFEEVRDYYGERDEPLPDELRAWEGDYIISYLSRWIVPDWLLDKARIASINFHPAPPEYPGFGCNNFALYENADTFGATCHHMLPKVDSGQVVAVKRFPVFPSDDVASLQVRTYDAMLVLFYDVAGVMAQGKPLPTVAESWRGKPTTRKQFNTLRWVSCDMDEAEVNRRIRATNFGPWKPMLELHGHVFELKTLKGQ